MKNNLFLLIGLFFQPLLWANTLTVSNANDSGNGSLRGSIAAAADGDTLVFSSSLANQTIVLASTLEIPVGKNLVIDGMAAPGLSISGNNAVRVFLLRSTSVNPTRLTLRHLRIINGLTTDYGGGVRSEHQGILILEHCHFQGNNAHQGGSAVFSHFEGRATIAHCSFQGNVSTAGNHERGSTVMLWGPFQHSVRHCTFSQNQGINGAAINGLNASLLIEDCEFLDNRTTAAVYDAGQSNPSLRGFGGAIYVDRASPGGSSTVQGSIVLRHCRFERNETQSDGGACYLYTDETDEVLIEDCYFNANKTYRLSGGSSPTGGSGGAVEQMNNARNRGFVVKNSTFANNEAAVNCGAIRADWADTRIENCTFYNNRALLTATTGGTSANGGALGFYSMNNSTVDIINCTFANNHAGWVGGAIATSHAANTRIKNSIFYQNTAANGGNTWNIQQHSNSLLVDLGNNLQYPNKFTNNGNDYNVSASVQIADPLLLPLANNGGAWPTMALQANSPAIDAGSGCPSTDQRGASRVGNCDIGAFEYGGNLSSPSPSLPQLRLFPNPNRGQELYLNLPGAWQGQMARLQVWNVQGQLLWSEEREMQEMMSIQFPQRLRAGLYVLRWDGKGASQSLKFVVEER